VSTQDPFGRARATGDRGTEAERVVVRDRRRIDPVTGEARAQGGDTPSPAPRSARPEPAADPDEVAKLTAELEERTADLQRLSAEFANYRRRVDRDRQAVVTVAKAQVVAELLTVLDDIDRAQAHGDLTGAFKLVADKLNDALTHIGLESYGSAGEPFDPAVHEAVQHASSSEVDGPTVSAVLRPGYRLGDRQLRPAMVAVTDRAGVEPADDEPSGGEPAGGELPGDGAAEGAEHYASESEPTSDPRATP
jgi:molecular chaperone GrpE